MKKHVKHLDVAAKNHAAKKSRAPDDEKQPPPEDELGGGDICSLEREPSTDDDKPLD